MMIFFQTSNIFDKKSVSLSFLSSTQPIMSQKSLCFCPIVPTNTAETAPGIYPAAIYIIKCVLYFIFVLYCFFVRKKTQVPDLYRLMGDNLLSEYLRNNLKKLK